MEFIVEALRSIFLVTTKKRGKVRLRKKKMEEMSEECCLPSMRRKCDDRDRVTIQMEHDGDLES